MTHWFSNQDVKGQCYNEKMWHEYKLIKLIRDLTKGKINVIDWILAQRLKHHKWWLLAYLRLKEDTLVYLVVHDVINVFLTPYYKDMENFFTQSVSKWTLKFIILFKKKTKTLSKHEKINMLICVISLFVAVLQGPKNAATKEGH